MTSATSFSREFGSIWNSIAPTTDLYVRHINSGLYQREFRPLASTVNPSRRALVNEAAFKLFCDAAGAAWSLRSPSLEVIQEAAAQVRASFTKYSVGSEIEGELDAAEISEVLRIFDRLRAFFRRECRGQIELLPRFFGCGFLDACAGDVYCERALFEVKSGDRTFRSIDVRQLLIYAALNLSSRQRTIDRVGLFNPRIGVSFIDSLDNMSMEVSGQPAAELLTEIVRIVSSGDVSGRL